MLVEEIRVDDEEGDRTRGQGSRTRRDVIRYDKVKKYGSMYDN